MPEETKPDEATKPDENEAKVVEQPSFIAGESDIPQDVNPEDSKVEPSAEETPQYSANEFEKGPDVVGKTQGETLPDENLVLNLENVSDSLPGFEPLPVGWYDTIIENSIYTKSFADNPMIKFDFLVTTPEYKNKHLYLNCTLQVKGIDNEYGLSYLRMVVSRAGIEVNWKEFSPKTFCEEGRALGKALRVHAALGKPYVQKSTGKTVRGNKVTEIAPAGSGNEFLAD